MPLRRDLALRALQLLHKDLRRHEEARREAIPMLLVLEALESRSSEMTCKCSWRIDGAAWKPKPKGARLLSRARRFRARYLPSRPIDLTSGASRALRSVGLSMRLRGRTSRWTFAFG